MSELLVFGDEDMMKEGEQRWPTEVVVSGAVSGEVTIFSRESCKVLLTEKGQKEEGIEEEFPGIIVVCLTSLKQFSQPFFQVNF